MDEHIRLEFITDDASIIDVCKRYWRLDADCKFEVDTSSLARQLGTSVSQVAPFLRRHARALAVGCDCVSCRTPYVLSTRSDWLRIKKKPLEWRCDACTQAVRAHEQESKEHADKLIRERLKLRWETRHPIDPCSLTLRDAVYLVTLYRHAVRDDGITITPLCQTSESMCGDRSRDRKEEIAILKRLYECRCIYINPRSPRGSIVPDANGGFHYYPLEVGWLVYNDHELGEVGLVDQVQAIFQQVKWPGRWRIEARELWREVALKECLEFYSRQLPASGLPRGSGPGPALRRTILALSDYFSIGQICGLIRYAAEDAAYGLGRARIPGASVVNWLVSIMESEAERAIEEGSILPSVARFPTSKQSMLSHVLLERAFGLSDEYADRPEVLTVHRYEGGPQTPREQGRD